MAKVVEDVVTNYDLKFFRCNNILPESGTSSFSLGENLTIGGVSGKIIRIRTIGQGLGVQVNLKTGNEPESIVIFTPQGYGECVKVNNIDEIKVK